eukprot:CAMPEP_0202449222 /NCGR_PEP_ID=MMETSP1360-20130828/7962_1 /ASSEMBLY_ACC=CAM_ASM_000848 /TAXON_ID=515479 /ORGANISM="Licmophora paradoxa, Strain CCMP2313" /LENGTH=301 /DNA_ID=CAMNT_0049067071 /DNA_START=46 /DNA_END=951 /DNA_ORIENTATION=+
MTDEIDPLSSFFVSSIDATLNRQWWRLAVVVVDAGTGTDTDVPVPVTEWSPVWIAAVSALFFGAIKILMGKKCGIEWYGFLHAIITGIGALVVIYLNTFASEYLIGIPEPLAVATCQPPLTSLHRILPSITMGFAIIDTIDSFRIGWDFIAHGIATFSAMALFIAAGASQMIAPFLVMEVSTIFLSLVRADWKEQIIFINQSLFSLAFFLCRIVLFPILHFRLMRAVFFAEGADCHHPYLRWAVLLFGLFFDFLNVFWFYKLIRKIKRKLTGKEKLKSKNDDLKQFSQEHHIPPHKNKKQE